MLYSVWNQEARAYDYYRSDEADDRVNGKAPAHLPSRDHGVPADAAAWPLPAGAKHVGRGEFARGHIASRRSAGNALGAIDLDGGGGVKLAGAAILAYLVWRHVR